MNQNQDVKTQWRSPKIAATIAVPRPLTRTLCYCIDVPTEQSAVADFLGESDFGCFLIVY